MEQAVNPRNQPLKSITIWYSGDTPNKMDLGTGNFSLMGVWLGAAEPMPQAEEQEAMICKVCSMDVSSCLQCHIHTKSHEQGMKQLHVCPTCKKLLHNSDSFHRHMKCHSAESPPGRKAWREPCSGDELLLMEAEACEGDDGLHVCSQCGESYLKAEELQSHLQNQHGKRLHKCRLCAEKFYTGDLLQAHEQTHSWEGVLVCSVCDENFRTAELLESHFKSHSSCAFTCRQCKITCDSLDALQNHLLFHKDDHPFLCGICGLSFSESSLLKEHSKIHGRESEPHHKQDGETLDHQNSLNRLGPLHQKMPGSHGNVRGSMLQDLLRQRRKHNGSGASEQLHWQPVHHTFAENAERSRNGVEVLILRGDFQCQECGKLHMSNKLLQEHMLSHSQNQPLLCTECGEVFDQKEKLLQHNKTHSWGSRQLDFPGSTLHRKTAKQPRKRKHPTKNLASPVHSAAAVKEKLPSEFLCLVCGQMFSQEADLRTHMLVHSGQQDESPRDDACEDSLDILQISAGGGAGTAGELHECGVCLKSFPEKRYLADHMRCHSEERPFECLECGITFKHRSGLVNHRASHGDPKFKCSICGKMFRRAGCLKDHSRVHTGEKPYECFVCDMKFAQRATLQAHREKHQEPLNKECSECGETYYTVKDFVDHMKSHLKNTQKKHEGHLKTHSRIPRNKPEDPLQTKSYKTHFKCGDCGENFSQRGSLLKHRVIHIGRYECLQCGKRFISQQRLERHANSHQRGRRIREKCKCDVCGRFFSNKTNMERHRKIHTGEKPFSCELCGKRFIQSGNLAYHMRTHSGEMTCQCDRCGKSFNASSKLLVHMRVHTGVRPFQCRDCGKAFKQSHQLTSHRRVHTGERPFSCTQCHKTFSRHGNLQLHLKMHRGEKSHVCKHCGKGFVQSSNLKVHLRTHAGKEGLDTGGGEGALQFGQVLQHPFRAQPEGWQCTW